jgi:hypothetical protein
MPNIGAKLLIEQQQRILDYLRTREGEVVKQREIAEALGYKAADRIHTALTRLIGRRALTRRGPRGNFTYQVNRQYVRRGRPAQSRTVSETSEVRPEVVGPNPTYRSAEQVLDAMVDLIVAYKRDKQASQQA